VGPADLLAAVRALAPEARERAGFDRPALDVPPGDVVALLARLREGAGLAFDLLLAHTAVDRVTEGRFELLYLVSSTSEGHELWVTTRVPRERPEVDSASGVYPIAEFQEREVYDMFGVLYRGHPDLRRILLEDGWVGFPLRKDYEDAFMLAKPEPEKLAR
jgi:NADH:ubiquinone oxidoreductase subunit C